MAVNSYPINATFLERRYLIFHIIQFVFKIIISIKCNSNIFSFLNSLSYFIRWFTCEEYRSPFLRSIRRTSGMVQVFFVNKFLKMNIKQFNNGFFFIAVIGSYLIDYI
uniref:Uncharacterized protein n=1 Tax=Cacopsylla melanoneura TaxID=428564 RepID=A0A8D8XB75_9HEMI